MAESKDRLSSKQQGMIRALLQGLSIRDAAKAGQVGERTVYRWLRRHGAQWAAWLDLDVSAAGWIDTLSTTGGT